MRCEVLADLVDAGEPMELVAHDYKVTMDELRQALAFTWSTVA